MWLKICGTSPSKLLSTKLDSCSHLLFSTTSSFGKGQECVTGLVGAASARDAWGTMTSPNLEASRSQTLRSGFCIDLLTTATIPVVFKVKEEDGTRATPADYVFH